jgi:hypothetical protein
MYLEIRTKDLKKLKFLDYEFPCYAIENDKVTKKSVLIKDIVVTNGFITTKNSKHTANNLIEFLSSLSHCPEEFYHFYFFRKDLEDLLCCIFLNTELKEFKIEECEYGEGELLELSKLDAHYNDVLSSKVVRIYQNLQLLYSNLNELITVRNEMLSKIPFSEREFNIGGHNNIKFGD